MSFFGTIFGADENKELQENYNITMEVMAGHDRVFECQINENTPLYKLGNRFTAVRFNTAEELTAYKRRAQESSYDFNGFFVFQPYDADYMFLLGEHIGRPFQYWAETENRRFWLTVRQYSQSSKLLAGVGKQVATILTMRHERNKYVGDLNTAVFVNTDLNRVTIVNLDRTEELIEVGISKDIQDFRTLLQLCAPDQNLPSDLGMFYELFPEHYPDDLESLKDLSYKVCHAPIFWAFRERWRFANFFTESSKLYRELTNLVTLSQGMTSIGDWHNRVLQLPKDNILRKLYRKGKCHRQSSVIVYHRNAMVHCTENQFLEYSQDIDETLVEFFPDVYSKAYVEFFSKFLPHCDPPQQLDVMQCMKGGEYGLYYGRY